jgi:uncharacterized protein (UPF0548 family)
MKFVRPSDSEAIERLLGRLRNAEPTYRQVGATLSGGSPEGFRHDRYEADLGRGPQTYQRAVQGLKTWKAHRLPGVRVFPEGQEIQIAATVIVILGTPVVALAAPCRIVGVVDEPARWGFAYGTLPGHPEQGEEAFVVSTSPDETVRFDIMAFSRPGDSVVRLSGPIGRGVQKVATKGYLRALRQYVEVSR